MQLENDSITQIKQLTYTKSKIYIFFDYPNTYTPLSTFIKKSRKPVNEKHLKKIFKHLLEITQFLREQEATICHFVPEMIFYNGSYRICATPPVVDSLLHHKKLRAKYLQLYKEKSTIEPPPEVALLFRESGSKQLYS